MKNLTEAQKNKMKADALKRLADNLTKAQAALKNENKVPKISSLQFSAKTYQIAKGKSVNLKNELTILPESAANQKLIWKISNVKFTKLNSDTGVVKALKKGIKKSVTVTVMTEDGKVSAKATVKVMKGRVSKVTAKAAKKVNAKAGNGRLAANAKVQIVKGAVKGKKVTITAVSTDGTNKKLKFTITVK